MTQDSSAPVSKLRVGTDYVYMCNLSPIGQNFQRGSDWNDLSRFLQHPLGPRLNKAARWKTPLVVRPPGSFHLIVSVDEQAALPTCQWPPKTRLVRFGSLWHGACSEWPFRFVLHLFVLPDSGGSDVKCKDGRCTRGDSYVPFFVLTIIPMRMCDLCTFFYLWDSSLFTKVHDNNHGTFFTLTEHLFTYETLFSPT